jgi:hypothetical protein
LEILVDVILPYLEDMKGRFHIDQMRIEQIKSLLSVISHCVPVGKEDTAPMEISTVHGNLRGTPGPVVHREHPGMHYFNFRVALVSYNAAAEVLIKIDDILLRVRSGIWASQLQKLLTAALNKQWRPIIFDNQRMFKNVGSKLVGLGIAELLGRPLLMLYPIYMVTMAAMKVVGELNTKKQPGPETYLQIIKGMLLLWGATRLMNVLSAFQGLGMSCLVFGCIAIIISVNDALTKVAAPIVAQHFVRIDGWVSRLSSFEQNSFSALSGFILQTNHHRAPSSSSSSSSTNDAPRSSVNNINILDAVSAKTTTAVADDELLGLATTATQVRDRTSISLDIAAVMEASKAVATAVGVNSMGEAMQTAEMLVKAAADYVNSAAANVHKQQMRSCSREGKATVVEIFADEGSIAAAHVGVEMLVGEVVTEPSKADAEFVATTDFVTDDDYDIPSLEELETMAGYQSNKVEVGENLTSLRRRRVGDGEN